MANPPTDINSILQMLQDSQQRAPNPAAAPSSLPARGPPGAPYGAAPQNLYAAQAAPYQPAPASYGYPQPAASGSIDLSAIKPAASGAVPSFEVNEAIAKARAMAQEAGLNPYDRQSAGYPGQDSRGPDSRSYQPQRSRSKSPRGRDAYRDNFNPYRDERRGDHGGQGRDYGRERSFSPRRQGFSPRGAHGNGRDRSPLRNKEENVETMEIEASLVGLIIGRQGENLRRVESESRCRVQFIPPNGNETFRLCRISGPRAQREEAKEMINRIIRDSGMRGGPPGGGGPGGPGERAGRDSGRPDRNAPPVPKEGEDSLQIMVPDRTVGLIIGRGGETIRDLQERSGCHINIVHESKSINGLRPVNLIGTPGAAKLAKDLILEIVDSDSRNSANNNPAASNPRGNRNDGGYNNNPHGGPDKINDSIYVPSDAVGMIIGKGGETIREMQNSTGCKINVSQSSGPNETQREIGLVGSRDSIERAKIAIQDKVDAARMKSGGGGGGSRGRGQHRDYDNPNYGQQSSNQHSSYAQQSAPASNAPPAAGANAAADPYAVYGGYENYLALWYSSQAAQQAPGQPGAGNA